MINVYVGKENLPSDKKLILDVEESFAYIWFTGDKIEKSAVREIEEGEYIDTDTWLDRFGYKRRPDEISNGSKVLICTKKNQECVYLGEEMGENAIDLFFREGYGNIYFNSPVNIDLDLSVLALRGNIFINGKEYESEDDLEGFIC